MIIIDNTDSLNFEISVLGNLIRIKNLHVLDQSGHFIMDDVFSPFDQYCYTHVNASEILMMTLQYFEKFQ